uniref:C2 domain-containing protein n=1 Tax=Rhabditophanes sp. KR3021 TaxID=114890 RepID=A0AC35UCH5_9BILA
MSKLFNGTMKIRLHEAVDIRPTEWSKRFTNNNGGGGDVLLDSYVNVDCDEYHVGQTSTKAKTIHPVWNEDFQTEVHNGKLIGFTLFHDCALPPDDFVANSRLYFCDLNLSTPVHDVWMDLEPHGRLHVQIELKGELVAQGKYLCKNRIFLKFASKHNGIGLSIC